MDHVKPKKKLGQHFLTDKNIAEKIVAGLSFHHYKKAFEVGAGTGILTGILYPLLQKNFVAVDVDAESVAYLKNKYPGLQVLEADFLKLNLKTIIKKKTAIIGNFPYNISSQIFFHLLDSKDDIPEIVCMIQKEVAERIASLPGTKEYGILSVLLQTWYEIEYLFTVKPGAFYPPPKVNSAVIRLRRNKRKSLSCDEDLFRKIVKTSFNQRRKIIRNSLKSYLLPLTHDVPFLEKRPEELDVEQFILLTKSIAKIK